MKNKYIISSFLANLLLLNPIQAQQEKENTVPATQEKNELSTKQKQAAWIGAFLSEVPKNLQQQLQLKNQQGVLVSKVIQASPAEKSGLKTFDIITTWNKKSFKPEDVFEQLRKSSPGEIIDLDILRQGKKLKIKLTLGTRTQRLPLMRQGAFAAKSKTRPALGIIFSPIPDANLQALKLPANSLIVRRVFHESAAEISGLKIGDIITFWKGKDAKTSLKQLISKSNIGDKIALHIIREGNTLQKDITLKAINSQIQGEIEAAIDQSHRNIAALEILEKELLQRLQNNDKQKFSFKYDPKAINQAMIITPEVIIQYSFDGTNKKYTILKPNKTLIYEGSLDSEQDYEKIPEKIRKKVKGLIKQLD